MNEASDTLRVTISTAGGATVVQVRGDVDLRSAPQLRTRLLDLARRLDGHMLVDLSGVNYIDSSGVGTMVFLKRQVERSGRRLVLIGPGPRVRSILEITRLEKFFTIVGSVDEVAGL